MDIMEQCQSWNQSSDYQTIIDAIEKLPKEERTPELDSELARAYNNIADMEDRTLYQKAIELLKPHEAYFEGDHNWNFRMGYAYYYLDQEGPALHYLEQALEARPGDTDTKELIDDCRDRLALPRFERSFRERTAESWAQFERHEGELRRLVDRMGEEAVGEELLARCGELLAPAFADVSFELGYNGEKYELILTPEGDRAKLFTLVYFQRRAPEAVLEHWNILVGRQPAHGYGFRSFGEEISSRDVRVWVEQTGDKPESATVSLTLYCEKLLPMLREQEGRAWWMLYTLTDQVIGEIAAMRLVDRLEVAESPKEGPGILLEALPQALEEMGLSLDPDPEHDLENGYTAYEGEPEEDPNADWRLDVFAGSTRCPALVSEYLQGESGVMDAFHRDGVAPGFFCYPIGCFAGEQERGKAALDFRDALEEAVLAAAGEDAVTFLGGASGVYCGYLDFIAWDLAPVLKAAKAFFKDSPVEWANFHVFRRAVSTVRLVDKTEQAQGGAPETDGGQEQEKGNTGAFVGFVLLSDDDWNREQLIQDLKTEWDLPVEGGEEEAEALVFSVGKMMAAVSLVDAPVPDREAEENAANNYMWPEAVETTKGHKAHLMVAVLGKEVSLYERGKLFTKIIACCCKQKNAIGVYTSGTVFQPGFYKDFADVMKEDELPIFNWIWFGLYRSEGGVCCYTYGMDVFGKDEMEVLYADAEPFEVRDFLANMASYVLENDVTLCDGETIGFSETQKLPITRSAGASLPGMTLKIAYGTDADG